MEILSRQGEPGDRDDGVFCQHGIVETVKGTGGNFTEGDLVVEHEVETHGLGHFAGRALKNLPCLGLLHLRSLSSPSENPLVWTNQSSMGMMSCSKRSSPISMILGMIPVGMPAKLAHDARHAGVQGVGLGLQQAGGCFFPFEGHELHRHQIGLLFSLVKGKAGCDMAQIELGVVPAGAQQDGQAEGGNRNQSFFHDGFLLLETGNTGRARRRLQESRKKVSLVFFCEVK